MKRFVLSCLMAAMLASGQSRPDDTAAVQAVVEQFHTALRKADPETAMRLIAEDAVFLEGGRIETRAEYEANHLPADIDFEKVIQSKQKLYRTTVLGNTAWVILTSDMVGTFENQPIDIEGATLMVLSREATGWKIRSIHWSSHRR